MPRKLIATGFDLTFIDIDVRPLEPTNVDLIEGLPPLGSHYTNTVIKFIPGGNGFNLARTLASLGNNVVYVGAINPQFQSLVKDLNLPLTLKPIPDAKVNYTCVLNFKNGEVQFNSLQGSLMPSNLTEELVDLYWKSDLKPISNMALNKYSIEWVSSLLLALVEPKSELIYSNAIPINEKLVHVEGSSFKGLMFIDPCDITKFQRKKELKMLLGVISSLDGDVFMSVNELEFKALLDLFNTTPTELLNKLPINVIYHSAKEVTLYSQKFTLTLKTKNIFSPVTFVGAGDCFNGGFIDYYLKGCDIECALKAGIDAATTLISTGNYPSKEVHI